MTLYEWVKQNIDESVVKAIQDKQERCEAYIPLLKARGHTQSEIEWILTRL